MSKAWAIEVQYPDRSRVSGTMFAAPTGPQHAGVQVLHPCIMIVWIGLTLAVPMICSWWSRNKYWTLCFYQPNVFKLWLQSGRQKGSRWHTWRLIFTVPHCHPCRLSNFVLRRPYCSEQDRLGDVFNTEVFARTGGMTEAGSIFDIFWLHSVTTHTSRKSQSLAIHWGGIYEFIKWCMSVGQTLLKALVEVFQFLERGQCFHPVTSLSYIHDMEGFKSIACFECR